jgi:FixJ family two-component response regulator
VRGNQERALREGAKAFLQKPVDNVEFLATIRKALGEEPAQAVELSADSGEFPLMK